MRRFVISRELPAVFTLALVGVPFAFASGYPALAFWLLGAAVWVAVLWFVLVFVWRK